MTRENERSIILNLWSAVSEHNAVNDDESDVSRTLDMSVRSDLRALYS